MINNCYEEVKIAVIGVVLWEIINHQESHINDFELKTSKSKRDSPDSSMTAILHVGLI